MLSSLASTYCSGNEARALVNRGRAADTTIPIELLIAFFFDEGGLAPDTGDEAHFVYKHCEGEKIRAVASMARAIQSSASAWRRDWHLLTKGICRAGRREGQGPSVPDAVLGPFCSHRRAKVLVRWRGKQALRPVPDDRSRSRSSRAPLSGTTSAGPPGRARQPGRVVLNVLDGGWRSGPEVTAAHPCPFNFDRLARSTRPSPRRVRMWPFALRLSRSSA